jgi:uncharacterized membrane protein YqhA
MQGDTQRRRWVGLALILVLVMAIVALVAVSIKSLLLVTQYETRSPDYLKGG